MKTKKWSRASILILTISMVNLLAYSPAGLAQEKYDATYGTAGPSITVATGSPGSLGLLEALAVPFCQTKQCRINWIKRGSGASLEALKAGEADVVMVHAPAAEKSAVSEGWATMRALLGSNEFYIVGPHDDPAGIAKAESAQEAFTKIAKAQSTFLSRGDNSGTHKKEMTIWSLAGIQPAGEWYVVTHDFMGPTLMRADRESGYFMTDSSTYYVKKSEIKSLKILFRGDPILVNVYHALVASPAKCPRETYNLAVKFVQFLESDQGQSIYRDFGVKQYGAALYNDAEYAKQWLE
jgi:tungstate transport system substrate-binding protein